MYPLHLLNPSTNTDIYIYICRHLVTAHFSQLINKVLTLFALIITYTAVHSGLKYQHGPTK